MSISFLLNLSGKLVSTRRLTKQRTRVMASAPTAERSATTRVKRNANFEKLQAGYLFPEVGRRRRDHQERFPNAKVISLGIGDTTEPIPPYIAKAMAVAAEGLATREGYSGYGSEQGRADLREAIAKRFYTDRCSADEIFVSDGSKCDIGRLQVMLGPGRSVAIQDPSYPAYVDTTVMTGSTGAYLSDRQCFDGIQYMLCHAENGFFPDLNKIERTDVVFFCSPNNPTGVAATREQCEQLVEYCRKNGTLLIYDAAYALYIENPNCPKTIYEIDGAEEVAIETSSFSKYAGFTGVRLGWTVVPKSLTFSDGSSVHRDFTRVATTCFNGASNIAQAGGMASLEPDGFQAVMDVVHFYKQNASLLRQTFVDLGFTVYGGTDAPYIWVGFPGQKSWDVFAEILEKCHIVTTPGSGFGPGGEGFVRVSAFSSRDHITEAISRFKNVFK